MQKKNYLYLSLIAVLFSGLLWEFQRVDSVLALNSDSTVENNSAACSNLDVVFIIDQSDSMSGESTNTGGSDPNGQREYAVEAMMDLLVDTTIDQCPDSWHRVAVISFGDKGEARVDLPFRNINPQSLDGASALRDELAKAIKADNLGKTYPQEAFDEAYKIFYNASYNYDEPRKKIIVYLTDGLPCPEDDDVCESNSDYAQSARELAAHINEYFPFDPTLLTAEQCLANLRDEFGYAIEEMPPDSVNECLKDIPDDRKQEFYERSTYLYMVLLKSDDPYPAGVLSAFEGVAQSHAGKMIELKRNISEVPTTMRGILSELVGIQPNLLSCGQFAVNPYLKQLKINVYNISDDNAIRLSYRDTEGNSHLIQAGKGDAGFEFAEPYYTRGVNERYVFSYPHAGFWWVDADNCAGVDVYVDEIVLEAPDPNQLNLPAWLPQYDLAPYYSADDQYKLEYQMLVDGLVVEQVENPFFAVDVTATIKRPDDSTQEVEFEYDALAKKFVATEPLQLPIAGTYEMTLVGLTAWNDGELAISGDPKLENVFTTSDHVLFSYETNFLVEPVLPFRLQEMSPRAGATVYNIHQYPWRGGLEPLPVRVRLTDRSGNPLTGANEIFTNQSQAISAEFGAQTIALLPDPDNPGEFFGEFSGAESLGEQVVTFHINLDVVDQDYRPDRQKYEITFVRDDDIWHRPTTYRLIELIALIVLVALIIYNIAIRTNKVSGELQIMDGGTIVERFDLSSGKNVTKIKKRELDENPHFGIKKMTIRNIGKKRRTGEDDGGVMGYGYDSNERGIRVSLVLISGDKSELELLPQSPQTYSPDNYFSMAYEPEE